MSAGHAGRRPGWEVVTGIVGGVALFAVLAVFLARFIAEGSMGATFTVIGAYVLLIAVAEVSSAVRWKRRTGTYSHDFARMERAWREREERAYQRRNL